MKFLKTIIVFVTIVTILIGCKDTQTHNIGPKHSIHKTVYTEQIELYAEITPMVKGEEATIIAHFTYLDTFKPVTEGHAVATVVAGQKSTLDIESPSSPGIYKFKFTPKAEGRVSIDIKLMNQKGANHFLLDSLMVFNEISDAQKDAHNKEIHHPNAVVFSKEMSWNVDFSTILVRRDFMGEVIHSIAQIQPSQGDDYTVSSKVSGIVNLISNTLVEGNTINAGQTICHIDASETPNNNLRVQYAQAVAEYNRAKSNYERLKNLEKDRLVTSSQMSEAKGEFESAEAVYKSLKTNFSSGSQSVTAPRSGFVKEILFNNGEYVNAGQSLLTITQNRSLYLIAQVQARYYEDLKNINGAVIKKINSDEKYSLEALNGRMISYSHQTSLENPLISVTFEINNVSHFLPGSFVEMFIKTNSRNKVLIVPVESVLEEMGLYFVYVQITPELFEKRQVVIGKTDGKNIEIKDGLKENERIVNHGVVLVKLQHSSGTIDPHAGHNH